jgi:predicted transcriptional regulator
MTLRQESILAFLARRGPTSLTKIGVLVGNHHHSIAPLWAASPLQKLVRHGWVDQHGRRYEVSEEGKSILSQLKKCRERSQKKAA